MADAKKSTKSTTKPTETKSKDVKKSNKKLIIGSIIAAVVVTIVAVVVAVVVNIANKPSLAIGTYSLTGMEEDGEDQAESLALIKAFGLTANLEIKDGESGKLNLFGEEVEFKYDDKYIIVDGEDGEEKTEYTYKDNQLTFEQDDSKLIFTKD